MHTVLRQVSYDYERMQYNTVVSGAMKMLNALEVVQATSAPTRCCARASASCCARSTRPARTPPWVLWQALGYAKAFGDLLDAPWPQVDETALEQDQIELMLQVNGKLRGAIRVPAERRQAGDRGGGAREPRLREVAEGRPSRRSSSCRGRLVNVVI